MSYDADPPTRRLDPQPPPVHTVRETELVPEHEALWRQQVLDRLGALRTAITLVGLLATAALGLGLYTLLTDEDRTEGDGRRGASTERVQRLDERVDELRDDVEERATKTQVDELREQQESLGDDVQKATAAAGSAGDAAGGEEVEQLRTDVEALQERVDALAQQGGTGGADAPADDGTTP